MFDWLRYLLSGVHTEEVKSEPKVSPSKTLRQRILRSKPKTLSQERDIYIGKLEKAAEDEEAKNKELEKRLEFKKREDEVLGRIRGARSHKETLWGHLAEYGVRRPKWLKWGLIGGGLLLLLLWVITC